MEADTEDALLLVGAGSKAGGGAEGGVDVVA